MKNCLNRLFLIALIPSFKRVLFF